ncbi:MAG: hypothetical protein FWF44_11330, partial [Defluviitaleaceae bacterium]|nr:hypothetical protein [Defluviitaleaceae bacterium]
MKKFRAILGSLLVLAMLFSLAACGGSPAANTNSPDANSPGSAAPGSPATTGQPAAHDSITIGVSSYLGRFLAGLSPTESQIGCDAVFDSIFRIDMQTKQPFSDILESW